jgi:hypothetical protein
MEANAMCNREKECPPTGSVTGGGRNQRRGVKSSASILPQASAVGKRPLAIPPRAILDDTNDVILWTMQDAVCSVLAALEEAGICGRDSALADKIRSLYWLQMAQSVYAPPILAGWGLGVRLARQCDGGDDR